MEKYFESQPDWIEFLFYFDKKVTYIPPINILMSILLCIKIHSRMSYTLF